VSVLYSGGCSFVIARPGLCEPKQSDFRKRGCFRRILSFGQIAFRPSVLSLVRLNVWAGISSAIKSLMRLLQSMKNRFRNNENVNGRMTTVHGKTRYNQKRGSISIRTQPVTSGPTSRLYHRNNFLASLSTSCINH